MSDLKPEVVEIGQVARLMRAGVYVNGQKVGVTREGHPVSVRCGHVVIDARESSRVRLDG